jgi:hypothetical protein
MSVFIRLPAVDRRARDVASHSTGAAAARPWLEEEAGPSASLLSESEESPESEAASAVGAMGGASAGGAVDGDAASSPSCVVICACGGG